LWVSTYRWGVRPQESPLPVRNERGAASPNRPPAALTQNRGSVLIDEGCSPRSPRTFYQYKLVRPWARQPSSLSQKTIQKFLRHALAQPQASFRYYVSRSYLLPTYTVFLRLVSSLFLSYIHAYVHANIMRTKSPFIRDTKFLGN
jgi:hypothetical protein